MQARIFTILLATLFTLTGCAASSQVNLGEVKTDVKTYVASGKYDADFQYEMQSAENYILSRYTQVKNPAIILDIDETSLSNLPQLEANDYSFFLPGPCQKLPEGPCGLKDWQESAKAKAFPATLHLFATARENHVAVFFITGREERVRKATEQNLHKAGYKDWTYLVMRPGGTKTAYASDYKSPERAKIEAKGYTIIASIGDQPSDLAGGHAEKTFLITNPFYRIP